MKVKSESEVAQSCPTPSNPVDCSPPGSSVYGIFQAKVLEWGAIAFFSDPQAHLLSMSARIGIGVARKGTREVLEDRAGIKCVICFPDVTLSLCGARTFRPQFPMGLQSPLPCVPGLGRA